MHPADELGSITPRMSDEQAGVSATAPSEEQAPRSRIRRMFSRSRELWRVVYRDPEHVAERLTLYTADRLGDPSREWAASVRSARPDTPVASLWFIPGIFVLALGVTLQAGATGAVRAIKMSATLTTGSRHGGAPHIAPQARSPR